MQVSRVYTGGGYYVPLQSRSRLCSLIPLDRLESYHEGRRKALCLGINRTGILPQLTPVPVWDKDQQRCVSRRQDRTGIRRTFNAIRFLGQIARFIFALTMTKIINLAL
jgi:hypothetical protein